MSEFANMPASLDRFRTEMRFNSGFRCISGYFEFDMFGEYDSEILKGIQYLCKSRFKYLYVCVVQLIILVFVENVSLVPLKPAFHEVYESGRQSRNPHLPQSSPKYGSITTVH